MVSRSALALTIALSSLGSAHAQQPLEGVEGRKHVVRVPSRELTRIAIENGRLKSMQFLVDELEVKNDMETGVAFVRPKVTDKQISLFVISASGATHELVLQPVETMPLESIVIRDPIGKRSAGSGNKSAIEKAGSLDQSVKRLMLIMARGEKDSSDIAFERLQTQVSLWNETRFVATGRYSTRSLVGEVFSLTNVSNRVMKVAEQELFKAGVVAVAIDTHILRPGEQTEVYVIRMQRDE
jgi:conjugal transfer pilus assembly protein TraK